MDLPADLKPFVTEHEPLAGRTYLGVGGPARWFAEPDTLDALCRLVSGAQAAGIPVNVLGLGANLLVADEGVDSLVICLSKPAFTSTIWPTDEDTPEKTGARCLLQAGGGADMTQLVLGSVKRGLRGLHFMAGIPGTVGGIICMNAGGRWGQISDAVVSVKVVDDKGEIATLDRNEIGFGYRSSDLEDRIVIEAAFNVARCDSEALREEYRSIWEAKKSSQPFKESTAGCVFKNPCDRSAGALIDQAGLKGRRIGKAFVSHQHANFIATEEGATASDVIRLIEIVRHEVAERFGVELETEVQVWGRQPAKTAGQPG
jgi:UDP-N-acetylmuramate dehydrogenase